jgi:ABC-type nitrate/sulfonate/bicarbonate transport system permease component
MWAGIFVTGVLGYFINTAMSLLERYLLPWSPENREH